MPYKTVTGEQIDKNTWYLNLPTGVTGGVSDVKFNGKSVVDANGVANINFPSAYVYGIDTDLTNLTCDIAAKQVYLNHAYDDNQYPAALRYNQVSGFGGVMPAHNFRRFVGTGRTVNYWLDPNDSSKKADGTDAVLTGADGDVLEWIEYLNKNYNNPEIIAVSGNVGQADELEGLEEKALKTGASKLYVEDLNEEFVNDFIYGGA